jgi:hypothetical protein
VAAGGPPRRRARGRRRSAQEAHSWRAAVRQEAALVETIDGEGGGWGRPGDDKRLRETETNGGVGRRGRGVSVVENSC